MKTEGLPSSTSYYDDEKRDLEHLLEAFGSMVSLEDIASAYCQARRNVYTAGEILCNMQESNSNFPSKNELEGLSASSEESSDNILDRPKFAERSSMESKPKKCSVSMGTVANVIGKEYAMPKPMENESYAVNKPLKLNSEDLPISEIWDEKIPPYIAARDETMHKDVEKFLFAMLGDGFQLGMDVIREVLGVCGYDVKKSMEKLLDLTASSLEKSEDVLSIAAQKPMEKCSDLESPLCQEKSEHVNSARSGKSRFITRNDLESPKRDKNRYDLQREILEALFTVPERVEKAPRLTRNVKEVRRSRAFGQVVVQPFKDDTTEHIIANPEPHISEDDKEDGYQALRKAAKEYWITMKEYYKAAVDAFAEDHGRAYKLLEEGNFFKEKAREANENSTQKLLETKDNAEDIPLDLHDHEPREAIRLLRLHLTSLCGIPSS
ncbi:putative nuclear RNA export factor SDE5 isoform X2 [Cornus florida]|uniref:putative nuclear RNA export factor SDE5 isoform X2 n=1 Tax=Cornus florida TaxID=4283 RepID=UPI0028978B87|nr:putative nuclear RNA export factor SDE5 isoform X2 [Cornus florida]